MRTHGALDRGRRHSRSDVGKKRKLYRGKKPKTRRMIKFDKRQGNKKVLKLRVMQRLDMSIEGWRNWNPKIRMRMHIIPKVYKWICRIDSPVADLTTKEDLEEWALTAIGMEGYFLVFGISHTLKNKFRRKWTRLFDVKITDTPEGLRAKYSSNSKCKIWRYWFWKN